jgi:hypothetical protein
MQLNIYTDTTTPSDIGQKLLRNGARRKLPRQFAFVGTALVVGATSVGGQQEIYHTIFDNAISEKIDPLEIRQRSQLSVPLEPLQEIDTYDQVPLELKRFLQFSGQPTVSMLPVTHLRDDEDIRLIPPLAQEFKIQVRFRKIGAETPRVWNNPDFE